MNPIQDFLQSHLAISDEAIEPVLYRLSNKDDREKFQLLLSNNNLIVHDQLIEQLKELLKSLHPAVKLKPQDYDVLIEKHLTGCPIYEYGVWVDLKL